jgi:hypothetical protein
MTGPGPGPGEMDEDPPTVGISEPVLTDNLVVFTITFNEPLAMSGDNAFTIDDLVISNAETKVLESTDNPVFMLKVKPLNEDFPVKVSFESEAKIADAADNLMVALELQKTETYTPPGVLGVEIDAPMEIALGVLTFTFTFAEAPDETGNGAFTVNDIRVGSNAEPLVAANLNEQEQSADVTEVVYELDVTPKDPTKPVTVQLKARSVTNGGAGTTDDPLLVAGQISATYAPPTPDTTPPIVAITAPAAAGASNSLVFTIDFDEALSLALEVDNLDIGGAAATPAPALAAVTTGLPATVAMRYTLTVTGTPGTAVTVNLKANAVMDAASNYVMPLTTAATFTIPMPDVDSTAPTVMITSELDSTGNVVFTITFADAAGISGALTYGDISVVNGRVIGDPVADATTAGVYTVTVTPTDSEQPVVLTVKAAAVTDASAEINDSPATSATYTPERDIPVVTFASTGDATVGGAFTVTITPDTGQTVKLSDIIVTQTASDGTQSVLTHTYNATTGEVTFTPTAAGTVMVSAKDVDSAAISVNPAGAPPSEDPAVMIAFTGDAEAGQVFTVTITPDTGVTVSRRDITVTQTDDNGVESILTEGVTYNSGTGEVTFTPTAAGTVVVSAKDVDSAAISVNPARQAVALTATAAANTVNGSTDIVVTLSATAPATVPSDLAVADFLVMEGETALTPALSADKTMLTITSAGTGDTMVTISPSSQGAEKIAFDAVEVTVDRTAPAIMFSDVTGAKADVAVVVTITVTGAAADEAVAVGDITVIQTLDDDTASVLAHTYNAGVVTFKPTAMSTVVVTVNAGAVMDAVGNGNAEASSDDIAVYWADSEALGYYSHANRF